MQQAVAGRAGTKGHFINFPHKYRHCGCSMLQAGPPRVRRSHGFIDFCPKYNCFLSMLLTCVHRCPLIFVYVSLQFVWLLRNAQDFISFPSKYRHSGCSMSIGRSSQSQEVCRNQARYKGFIRNKILDVIVCFRWFVYFPCFRQAGSENQCKSMKIDENQ